MRIHFIAIGGAVMHNLAIALKRKGYIVTGSDDEIFDPARMRLQREGLLPGRTGWYSENITADIDIIILGMHARMDNPELVRARELNLVIKSFPEFLYEQTKLKKRIVIGGSHGKTTITSMIMHVLKSNNIKFDYMVGSIIEGFETMVGLSDETEIAVFEGDEYLTSTLDRRPKFHLYHPDIAVISGIAWDHINVFPEYEGYVEQFRIFAGMIEPNGTLIYNIEDSEVRLIGESSRGDINKVPYRIHQHTIDNDCFILSYNNREYRLKVFGDHNMQNISAAHEVCRLIEVPDKEFYKAISSFEGSAKRLQLLESKDDKLVYLDFAHAPSKVRATVKAIGQRYPDHKKVCCLELHTYSSLSTDFLKQYKDCFRGADDGYVYFNPHAIKLKQLSPLSKDQIMESFGDGVSQVFNNSDELFDQVTSIKSDKVVYLFMSSGDFNGTDLRSLAVNLVSGSEQNPT